MKESNSSTNSAGRESNERVIARNAIALKYVKAKKISVNDLFTPLEGHSEYYTDGVHFKAEGIAIQADQVAAKIREFLSP